MFDEDKTFKAVVEEHFPYDGPHTPESVLEAARGIAALVRYLNNATGPGNDARSLPDAPWAYRVLGSVHGSVDGLEQLLYQLATALDRLSADPTLYDDRRGCYVGRDTAHEAAGHLAAAQRTLAEPRAQLAEAWKVTSHLGHDLGAVEDEEGSGVGIR